MHPPLRRAPPPDADPAFSTLILEPATRSVRRDGQRIVLTGRAYALLAALVAQPGRLFSTEALLRTVWPGRVVEAQNLRVQILHLRRMLGPDVVLDVPGRGYMLGLPVSPSQAPQRDGLAPSWREPLLGREAELQRLDALLAPQRPITLVGPAGVGKTRLAAELARLRRPRHPDGTWWVDLVRVPEAAAVPTAIAHALQLQTGGLQGVDAPRRVGLALAGRDLLLVLDNAEHLAADLGPVVHALLAPAPTLSLLITSRQRLQCPGERVLTLPPLALPAPDAPPAHWRANPALQLLVRQARQADAGYALAPTQLADAVALCHRLEGLPLALELAGATLPRGGLAGALERLAAPPAAAPSPGERHQSVHSALAWSHAQLDDTAQRCLRRLVVFAAGFRLHEAQQVAALDDLSPEHAMRGVAMLARHSLLQVHEGHDPPRHRLLESTRQFALHLLRDAQEEAASRQRHLRAMTHLAAQATRAFWLLPDAAWLDQWQADGPDWLQACDLAVAQGDADAAAELSGALAYGAAISGQYAELRPRIPGLVALATSARGRTRALLLDRLAVAPVPGIARLDGAHDRVAAWRAVGDDPAALARALAHLALAAEMAGDRVASDASLAEAEALELPGWTARERAYGTARVAPSIAARRQDLARMERAAHTLQGVFAACGSPRMVALAGCDIGMVELYADRPLAAAVRMEAAANSLRQQRLDVDAGITLGMLAGAWLDADDLPQAAAAMRQSVALLAPDPDALRFGLEVMAWLAARQGHGAEAARLLGASESVRQRTALARNPLNARVAQAAERVTIDLLGRGVHDRHLAAGRALDAAGAMKLARRLWPTSDASADH